MSTYDLSVIIAARNEAYLGHTVEDILRNRRGKTDVIVVSDGGWPVDPLPDHPDVTLLHEPKSIGQRAAVNLGAAISRSRWIMKSDAHVSFSPGFDTILMRDSQPNWVTVPLLYNLHVFNHRCMSCGVQTYQGPDLTHCTSCDKDSQFEKVMVWLPRDGKHWQCLGCWKFTDQVDKPESCSHCGESKGFGNIGKRETDSMLFDETPHFQYFRSYHPREGIAALLRGKGPAWTMRLFEASLDYASEDLQAELRDLITQYDQMSPQEKYPLRLEAIKFGEQIRAARSKTKETRFGDLIRAAQGDIVDTMSLLGACWFLERRFYWDVLGGLDEAHGNWGSMGIEIAGKAWLSGNRLVCHRGCSYAHLFRTASGFSFPYKLAAADIQKARDHARNLWFNNAWPGQKYPLSWLIDRFAPVPGWSQEGLDRLKASEAGRKQFTAPAPVESVIEIKDRKYVESAKDTGLTVGIVYYTDNRLDPQIMETVQRQILRGVNGHQLVSVSLKPLSGFGDNIVLGLERGYLTMAQQILTGLSTLDTDIAFMCEHDVLYAEDYFSAFVPLNRGKIFYNENVWRLRADTGETLFHYHKSLSQMCADRRLLIDHFRERIARLERGDSSFRMGFEPGCKSLSHGGVDNLRSESWFAPTPNIDIWHGRNTTKLLWSRADFRNQKYTEGWQKRWSIPGWPGTTRRRFPDWLAEIMAEVSRDDVR